MSLPNQGPRRIGQWLYLKPECIEEYKKCHAKVWPEVLEQIKDSNIKDCQSVQALVFLGCLTGDNRFNLFEPRSSTYSLCQFQIHGQRFR